MRAGRPPRWQVGGQAASPAVFCRVLDDDDGIHSIFDARPPGGRGNQSIYTPPPREASTTSWRESKREGALPSLSLLRTPHEAEWQDAIGAIWEIYPYVRLRLPPASVCILCFSMSSPGREAGIRAGCALARTCCDPFPVGFLLCCIVLRRVYAWGGERGESAAWNGNSAICWRVVSAVRWMVRWACGMCAERLSAATQQTGRSGERRWCTVQSSHSVERRL